MRKKLAAAILFATMLSARADWSIKIFQQCPTVAVSDLAAADALIANASPIGSTNMALADMTSGAGSGRFGVDNAVPGIPDCSEENFAVQGTGYLIVPLTGQYTFALNTDDGARLRINGTNVIVDDGLQPQHDSPYATISLTAGLHPIEWTWFNGPNFGEAEVFAAPGTLTSFDCTFKLVGTAPGLVVVRSPPAAPEVQASIFTAVEICWNSATNTYYQVQWKSPVDSTNWMNLYTPIEGTGTNVCVFDSTRQQSKRFYRVMTLQ